MTQAINGARGEVALKIADVDLVIAATMSGLAAVSTRLECKSIGDLFLRLSGTEIAAATAAISLLTVKGDADAAISKLKLKHFAAVSIALTAALAHHFEEDAGNVEAVKA